MLQTPKSNRLHIGILGRRNVGKSSLLNALVRQRAAIVSDVPGATADPVEKPFELQPLGPVLFVDTAGVDDQGSLGERRVEATRRVLDRIDLALLVTDGDWNCYEQQWMKQLAERKIPTIVVLNKSDEITPTAVLLTELDESSAPYVLVSAKTGDGLAQLRQEIVHQCPADFVAAPPIVADLLPPGELAMLVIPIDMEAPKGRLILPQVQTIRDLLDNDSYCMVV